MKERKTFSRVLWWWAVDHARWTVNPTALTLKSGQNRARASAPPPSACGGAASSVERSAEGVVERHGRKGSWYFFAQRFGPGTEGGQQRSARRRGRGERAPRRRARKERREAAMALAFARKLVSKKKIRFVSKEDGFNLDLTCTSVAVKVLAAKATTDEGLTAPSHGQWPSLPN